MVSYGKELEFSIDLVRKASMITEWFKRKGFESFLKSDESPVTLADLASQIYIISQLKKHFSEDEIIAEEENIEFIDNKAENLINKCFNKLNLSISEDIRKILQFRGRSSNCQWSIDPIDGTIGYQKGLSYAIGIGFMVKSDPKVCAIAIPNYKNSPLAIFAAEKGQGSLVAYDNRNFNSIRVSQNENINNLRLCHSLHYDQPWVLEFAQKVGIRNFIQIDSMAKFCMVADGTADLYIKPLDITHSFTWDFMPGSLIVREAGGYITDLKGELLKFEQKKCIWTAPGIIASNSIIHNKILELYNNTQ